MYRIIQNEQNWRNRWDCQGDVDNHRFGIETFTEEINEIYNNGETPEDLIFIILPTHKNHCHVAKLIICILLSPIIKNINMIAQRLSIK